MSESVTVDTVSAATSETLAIEKAGRPQLDYLPVGLFGSVLGLTGLASAWRLAEGRYGAPHWIAAAIGVLAVLAFLAMCIGYGVKSATAWSAVQSEFRHPIAGNLFALVPASMLLLPIVLVRVSPVAARIVWIIGAAEMLFFAWFVVNRWMSERQQVVSATPVWVVPVVGLLDVPLALPVLGLPPMHGLVMFDLAVGLFFSTPLFTLIFSRLLFETPLPSALRPSLLILMAPFAVAYSSYMVVAPHPDLFSEALYMLTLFLMAVLLAQMRYLRTCCPFRVSWWAVSFPLAAATIGCLRFAADEPGLFADAIALAMLVLTSLIIAGLLVRTLVGLARSELRTLSA
jgi:tellurite resistance protein